METPIIYPHAAADGQVAVDSYLNSMYEELLQTIAAISDSEIIAEYKKTKKMSISHALNNLLDKSFTAKGWDRQTRLFSDSKYVKQKSFRLDFSKTIKGDDGITRGIAVEVAFNHGEAISWNLLKPVLAAEQNHIEKDFKVDKGIGVVIVASDALKKAGAFDSAVGSYEKYLRYLLPMSSTLNKPMFLIGLKPPKTFKVLKVKNSVTKRNSGEIELIVA